VELFASLTLKLAAGARRQPLLSLSRDGVTCYVRGNNRWAGSDVPCQFWDPAACLVVQELDTCQLVGLFSSGDKSDVYIVYLKQVGITIFRLQFGHWPLPDPSRTPPQP
jgi:hypothetical protein